MTRSRHAVAPAHEVWGRQALLVARLRREACLVARTLADGDGGDRYTARLSALRLAEIADEIEAIPERAPERATRRARRWWRRVLRAFSAPRDWHGEQW